MKWLIAITVFTVIVAVYVTWLRPLMRTTSWGQRFLNWIEPIERKLWWKSETILWQRFKYFLGSALSTLVVIDWNSLSPIIPEKYRGLVVGLLPTIFITIDGWIGEKLRKETTKPLEIVAMRTDAPPEIKEAVVEAEVKTAQTVAAVKDAGAV